MRESSLTMRESSAIMYEPNGTPSDTSSEAHPAKGVRNAKRARQAQHRLKRTSLKSETQRPRKYKRSKEHITTAPNWTPASKQYCMSQWKGR